MPMVTLPIGIVKFCAEEVDRQGRGAIQVFNMVEAWSYAMRQHASGLPLTTAVIQECGRLIEPTKNDGGWRKCGVRVGDRICPPPQEVPELMNRYVSRLGDMTPEEAYLEYQLIHGFADGNGRAGKIIYAWLKNELAAPTLPPNFFGCVNL